MVMFRMFYLGLSPHDSARHFLGISEMSWVKWSEDVRRRCGQELLRREMFPPRKYFRKADKPELLDNRFVKLSDRVVQEPGAAPA